MAADVVISAPGAMSGDARQEAYSQQCKTKKNVKCRCCLIVVGWFVLFDFHGELEEIKESIDLPDCVLGGFVLLSKQWFCKVFGRGGQTYFQTVRLGGPGEGYRER